MTTTDEAFDLVAGVASGKIELQDCATLFPNIWSRGRNPGVPEVPHRGVHNVHTLASGLGRTSAVAGSVLTVQGPRGIFQAERYQRELGG
jgi:hypothetical protein